MNKQIIVIAPHPDDETLGCGGTILRHIAEGDIVHWLIITGMQVEQGFSKEQVQRRDAEIKKVALKYGFSSVHDLRFPAARLESLSIGEIIKTIGKVFAMVTPEVIYIPYRGDIHSDHRITFDAVSACTKWFRYGSVKRVLAYETLSETDFGINPDDNGFRPNVFVDISKFLETKLEIMKIYSSEFGTFPFPRSEQAIRALAAYRGATAGCLAAEAFMLLKEIV
ncbi:MAG TPA: PIG-L family deacetylase [Clostridia bacterium]|nr:PIG-L family deacetylase [Clostridia bacterium]